MKDRLIAIGIGSIVGGYSDIEDVKIFVSEYQKTGKMGRNIPLPYVNFANATEDFPEAQTMFASELEATKKMEAQIKSIIEMITAEAEKRTADAEKRTADAEKRTADAEKRTADAEKRTQKAKEDIRILQEILRAIK